MSRSSVDVTNTASTLPRQLGLWSSVAIVVGITIGSGIFRTPAVIATRVPDPTWMLAVWIAGGIITLCGALSFAELSASLPRTGGLYVYLREGWNRPLAFLFGWAELVLIRASALGGMATVSSEYLLRSFGIDPSAHEPTADALAAGAIVVAAAINIRGARPGAAVAAVSTVVKFGALTALVVCAFAFGASHGASFDHFRSAAAQPVQAGLFGLALISVLWAYDGFADISLAAGEVKDPGRSLPRAIVGGTLAIVAIYLATNAAYLYVMPIDAIARSPLVAANVMEALFGRAGVTIISLVITVSAFGALNGSTLAAPRVFFAMAEDKLFFPAVARVHPTYQTPHVAILIAAALGVTFVAFGSFQQLADIFVISVWPFYGFSVAALYRLRARQPDLPRPYKVPGYPVVPAIFIGGVVYLVLNALITDTLWTAVTFAVLLAGLPVYYVAFAAKATKTN